MYGVEVLGMPQQSAPPAPRPKTTKVQKILKDEGLRRSVQVTWQSERSQTDGLEVLARCKALNEFIRTGLLAEVEDNVAQGFNSARSRSTAAAAAAKHPSSSAAATATKPATGSRPSCLSTDQTPKTPSLANRITAQESVALLDLLLSDEVAAAEAASRAAQSAATTPVPAAGSVVPAAGSSKPAQAALAPLAAEDTTTTTTSSSSNSNSSSSSNSSTACEPAPAVDTQAQTVRPSTSDMLDDVIGLLNAPGVQLDLVQDAVQEQPSEQAPDLQQQQGAVKQQDHQPLQQQPQTALRPLPPAACREAHRQSWVRPPQQQQEDLKAAATKHASINSAWQGFYTYWGPRAASTIQHYWRCYKAKQQYLQLREAATVLQAYSRGHLLRVGPDNALRLHRAQQQRQQQQRQREAELQQQQEREAQQRKMLLQRQQEEREAAHERQRAQEATLVLQCAVRGWAARRLLAETAAAAAAAAAEASAAVKQRADSMSSVLSTCSGGSDTDSCSRGSSRQSHSRGSTVCSSQASAAPSMTSRGLDEASEEVDPEDFQQQRQQPQCEDQHELQQDVPEYVLSALVIRHAAEKRTASHGGDAGVECREVLARQLVQRAGQLGAVEGLHAAELAARTLMASSSARQLKSAMQAVRSARPTM